jgi:hypothetical protein
MNCSESFYKESIQAELKVNKIASEEEKRELQDLLRAYESGEWDTMDGTQIVSFSCWIINGP